MDWATSIPAILMTTPTYKRSWNFFMHLCCEGRASESDPQHKIPVIDKAVAEYPNTVKISTSDASKM